jgi:hypothetical protein
MNNAYSCEMCGDEISIDDVDNTTKLNLVANDRIYKCCNCITIIHGNIITDNICKSIGINRWFRYFITPMLSIKLEFDSKTNISKVFVTKNKGITRTTNELPYDVWKDENNIEILQRINGYFIEE